MALTGSELRLRRISLLAWLLAAGAVLGLGHEAWQLREAARFNAALRAGDAFEDYSPETPRVLFARAYALHEQRSFREALAAYDALSDEAAADVAAAVEFNVANLYMQYADELARTDGRDLAAPLIELAKESYRELLRGDSGHWDAKYNLELALALAPENDDIEAADEYMPEHSRRAAGSAEAREDLP